MRPRPTILPWLLGLLLGAVWALLPILLPPPIRTIRPAVSPQIDFHIQVADIEVPAAEPQLMEAAHPPPGPPKVMPKSNLTRPFSEMYFPPLPTTLYLRNLPCVGIRDWPAKPPKPIPKDPRFVLLVDSWERQQTGLKTVESAATIAERYDLVFVLPNVRNSNIQGIPGWTQWRSSHALDGFTGAKYLLPMSEYFDINFTRGFFPLITFEDYIALNNYTITTALMLDWEHDKCRNRPEWFPAHGARIQATQLYCFPARFPSTKLTRQQVDQWLTPGAGDPLPEADGRLPPKYPSVALLNWRKCSLGEGDWYDELWGKRCRFRWARKWNDTAVAWAKENLPDRYVAIKIRSGNWLRWFWIPKKVDDVRTCFTDMARAAKYYLRQMGLPEDAPVFLSTEWPNPPESRWHFGGVSIMTASFNALYKELNVVTYRNKAYDLGIVTVISFNLLINAAVLISFEDTMTEFARMYNPSLPVAIVGTMSRRICDLWDPPNATTPPPQFLYLVQGKTFLERLQYSQNSDMLCLTWQTAVPWCDHKPGTTWTTGRNYLWAKAVRLPRRYDYYVFLDDDIFINTMREYERMLLKWRPAIGVPGWAIHYPQPWGPPRNESEALRISAYHGYITAFHQDVMFHSLVLPYYDGMDHFSWWTSQVFTIYLGQVFHPGEVLGFQKVPCGNDFSGNYPKQWDINVMNRPFLEECITNETLRKEHWKGFALEAETIAAPLSPTRGHALPNETLAHFLGQPTDWWRKIRALREEALGPQTFS